MNNKIIVYSRSEYTILKNINKFKDGINQLNVSEIDISNISDPREIIEKCETLPLLFDKKRVVTINAKFLHDDYKDKYGIFKCLKKYVKNLPDFTVLILYLYKRDKREKISKRLKELQNQGMNLIVDGDERMEKLKIISEFVRSNDIRLDQESIDFMITANSNMDMLINDIFKLKFMDNISIASIKKVFSSLEEEDTLDLLNYIADSSKIAALKSLNILMDTGFQPIQIIKSIMKQYQRLIYCKSGIMANKSIKNIAKEYKLHPYFCKRLCGIASNLNIYNLSHDLQMCRDLMIKIMNVSQVDTRSELEILILRLK